MVDVSVPPSADRTRDAGSREHNLPYELTAFVGREHELAEVAPLLATHRLVTLTGPGGCGKTRLATRLAADLLPDLAGGAWLVDLALCSDPDLVPQMVAEAVAVREAPGTPVTITLSEALRGRDLLLLLDNCEHLREAVARLTRTVLEAAPHVRVLATSRRSLGLRGEVVWRVPPLRHRDAEALFVERARRRMPGFVLTPATSRVVAEICRGLDGLPLAIELATAWVPVLAVDEIAGMLSDCLALLSSDDRTAEPRHRSLEAALGWSHDLLDEPQRRLFERLSVYSGWWGRDAAEASAAGLDPHRPVLDLLGELVDQSLVLAETGVAGTARYRMLAPVRQFGLARLVDRGAEPSARRAHADFCAAVARSAAPHLRGREQLSWLRRLDDAEADLRAAIAWSLAAGEAEQVAELGWSLWLFWWLRGRFAEGRRAMEQVLAVALSPHARARASFVAGTMACGQADYGWAADRLHDAIALFGQVGDPVGEAHALSSAGFAAIGSGDRPRGTAHLERGVELALGAGDRWAAAFMLCFLATLARDAGEGARARGLGHRALELSHAVGDREGAGMASYLLAGLARDAGDDAAAAGHYVAGLRMAAEVGDVPNVAFCLQGLAAGSRDPRRAVRLWSAADTLLDRVDGGGYVYRPDQERVRDAVAAARRGLGGPVFEAAWAAGRALSPGDLLDEAGSGEPAGPERPSPGPDPDGLTAREAEVLDLIAAGRANKQIASELSISVSTVEQHVTRLYTKIGARGRAAATVHALRRSARLR